jgi:hypothetical protein
VPTNRKIIEGHVKEYATSSLSLKNGKKHETKNR